MSVGDEPESLVLADGRTRVRFEVTAREMSVVTDHGNGESRRVSLPYPMAGYGGHELVLSARERFLAVFLYSGQSEQGYELFELRPRLHHLGGLAYVFGEGHPPVFSPDERFIAMASAVDPSFGAGNDLEEPSAEGFLIDWAEVRVQELPRGPVHLCTVRLSFPRRDIESDDARYPEGLRFSPEGGVAFATPWGREVSLGIPMPESILLPGPPLWR
jgi:hypothetical protein